MANRNWYMHLMGLEPAYYAPGKQIMCSVMTRPIILVPTLRQIYREQRAGRRWRRKQGYPPRGRGEEYSYRRIQLPKEHA